MEIVKEVDKRYPKSTRLYPNNGADKVEQLINKFKTVFPQNTRPSSRAAFLFSYYGDLLTEDTFKKTLEDTEKVLEIHRDGPFMYGDKFTAADIAWAPFLERYSAQLPILYKGKVQIIYSIKRNSLHRA